MARKTMKKKKTGSMDNPKIFTYITVGLGAIIAIITAVVLIIYFSNNYVAKVNGQKIYDYEYEYYLYLELSKMQTEVDVTDLSEEERTEKYREFWNTKDDDGLYPEERAKEAALEAAREYIAAYQLAKKEGFKLSRKEEKTLKLNIDMYIQQMYYQYQSYGMAVSKEDLVRNLSGTMNMTQYKNYMVAQAAIEKYKDSLKETYSISDEEIKSIYDEDRDTYRYLDIRVLYKKALNEDGEELSEQDYEAFLKEMQELAQAFNEEGEYDEKGFVEYIKEFTEEESTDGFYVINKEEGSHPSGKINEYVYSLEREDIEKEEYYLIEDEDMQGIYIVLLEKIVDLETKKEDIEDEDGISGEDIREKIVSEIEEEMAEEEIKKAVGNDNYKLEKRKEKIIQSYLDDWDLRNQ